MYTYLCQLAGGGKTVGIVIFIVLLVLAVIATCVIIFVPAVNSALFPAPTLISTVTVVPATSSPSPSPSPTSVATAPQVTAAVVDDVNVTSYTSKDANDDDISAINGFAENEDNTIIVDDDGAVLVSNDSNYDTYIGTFCLSKWYPDTPAWQALNVAETGHPAMILSEDDCMAESDLYAESDGYMYESDDSSCWLGQEIEDTTCAIQLGVGMDAFTTNIKKTY